MSLFEQYHPVLTPNYKLDWLTKTPVVEMLNSFNLKTTIHTIDFNLPTEVNHIITFVNQTMSQVMNEQELTWAITDRHTNAFLGIVKITQLTEPVATISYVMFADNRKTLAEVLQRVVLFIQDHFVATSIQLFLPNDQNPLTTNQLVAIQLGFQPQGAQLSWILELPFE